MIELALGAALLYFAVIKPQSSSNSSSNANSSSSSSSSNPISSLGSLFSGLEQDVTSLFSGGGN